MGPATKKINFGSSYLSHPKFQNLITAFKNGTSFKFDVTDKSKTYTISTEESHILFDGKVIFYSRPLNKYEDNLLLDRASTIQYQGVDALVHLAFAILRSFQELGTPQLSYLQNQFYYGSETLEFGMNEQGPNLLIGSYKHTKTHEKAKK